MGDPFSSAKIFQHMDRLAVWQSGGLPAPVTVELDLTNACNHACPGCTFSYLVNKDKSNLPFDLAQRVVRELAAMGVRAVTFSGGGEPLVYGPERVLALIELVHQLGMDSALITNGSLLMPEEGYATCQWVRVSLDAYSEETFERFHGRGKPEFRKVVGRIVGFGQEAQRRRAAGLRWPTFGLGFLTDDGSLERGDVWSMSEYCAVLPGVDYLQFRPLVKNMVDDPTLSGGYERLDAVAYRQQVGAASSEFGRGDFRVLSSADKYHALSQPDHGRHYDRCLAHFLEAAVSANGHVYICCHGQGIANYCLGNLHEQSFSEVWHSERARSVYESISPKQHCPPACRLHPQNELLHQIGQGATHKNFI